MIRLSCKISKNDFVKEKIEYTNASFDLETSTLKVFVDPFVYDINDSTTITIEDDINNVSYVLKPSVRDVIRQGYIVKGGKRFWCINGIIRIDNIDYDAIFSYSQNNEITGGTVTLENGNTYQMLNASSEQWKKFRELEFSFTNAKEFSISEFMCYYESYSVTYSNGINYELFAGVDDKYYFIDENDTRHEGTIRGSLLTDEEDFGISPFEFPLLFLEGTIAYPLVYSNFMSEELPESKTFLSLGMVVNDNIAISESNHVIIRIDEEMPTYREIRVGENGERYVIHLGNKLVLSHDMYREADWNGEGISELIYDELLSSSNGLSIYRGHFANAEGIDFYISATTDSCHYSTIYDPSSPIFSGGQIEGDATVYDGVYYDKKLCLEKEDGGRHYIAFSSNIIGDFSVTYVDGKHVSLEPRNNFSSPEDDDLDFKNQVETMYAQCLLFGKYTYGEVIDGYYDVEFSNKTSMTSQLLDKISLYCEGMVLKIPIGVSSDANNSLMRDFRIERLSENSIGINNGVDMDKTLYTPCIRNEKTNLLEPCSNVTFNLHFRTRTITDEGWAINDQDNPTLQDFSHWFVTDIYKSVLDDYGQEYDTRLYKSSDLLGLLGFTDLDVYLQKKRLAKSFLRITYYDSNGPDRKLVAMSTIFINTKKLFSTYIKCRNKSSNLYDVVAPYKQFCLGNGDEECVTGNIITTLSEPVEHAGVSYLPTLDENSRISCGLSVKDMISSEDSSEGYYIYLYKDYVDGFYPQTLYMKVEFNHAGYGIVVPFMLPVDENGTPYTSITEFKNSPIYDGIDPAKKKYYELIPINISFDQEMNKYVYTFGDSNKDNEMVFNLFETKLKQDQ